MTIAGDAEIHVTREQKERCFKKLNAIDDAIFTARIAHQKQVAVSIEDLETLTAMARVGLGATKATDG